MNFGANLRINKCGWITIVLFVFFLVYLKTDKHESSSDEMVSLKLLLEESISAAKRGGNIVVKARKDGLDIRSKGKTAEGANDPVTSADLASNCAMVGGLVKAFPRVTVMSEEGSLKGCEGHDLPTEDTYDSDIASLLDEFVYAKDVVLWVDPLDATQEYTEGLTEFVTTMVCVAVKGVPVLGVIHFPFANTTSWAWHTKRVSSNLQSIVYNKSNETFPRVVVSRSHPGEVNRFVIDVFGDKYEVTHAAGAGYKVMQVASDKADVYLHTTRIKKWDICAGHALITTLGGSMTTLDGDAIRYDAGDVVNTDGLLVTRLHHDHYLTLIKKYREALKGKEKV